MSYGHGYPWQIWTRMAGLDLVHRIAQRFDVDRLQSELQQVLAHYRVVPHYRPYLASGWGAISLVAPNGDPSEHRPAEAIRQPRVEHLKTPVLEHAPYMESIIDAFDCPKRRVRLMELAPGKDIFWHHDGRLFGIDRKVARFHIPIVTNPDAVLQVSHHDCQWQPGELWFLDNSFPHRLRNGGDEPRIHMVIDLESGDFVRSLFPAELHAQEEKRKAARTACMRMHEATYGLVFKAQKRLELRRRKRRGDVVAHAPASDAAGAAASVAASVAGEAQAEAVVAGEMSAAVRES